MFMKMWNQGQTLDVIQRILYVWKMGYINYLDALKLQEKLVCDWNIGKIPDTLLSLQHPPRYSLVSKDEIQCMGVELHHTNREGDVTFHGPAYVGSKCETGL
ncbi:hypothetical protein MKW94_006368 [Papaver nudicaule]|uniref:Uncharacterized protein n=1 Tax=Papaver nudicaule TaxID=74823 RepID=A0AA41VT44_PAPNU|nr:hypothetical protein [Papaver nudicaule]